ncbi:FAD-dependent monooxygenase [Azospirillum sp.]|uniref:FAD-dependent monooxygenase n=1 Tax=Azospirillum sp. TaxID=34012 RepID=UPI002D341EEC|nr:FAD-dependent monooxygenase [Azospirillum sp.]HYD65424.1 FAD-dependent monooxygenase [Azospirillum sp.]
MHAPDAKPRASVFYEYAIHPYRRPPEMDGNAVRHPVVIVGAGPIGMVTALDLARFGVPSVILEQELQVSHGSRAIVLTRRSMEILQQVGVAGPFLAKGLQWSRGRSFYRGREVYQMVMPHDADDRFLPGLNIQQQYIEEYLVDAVERSGLIDLRWGSKVLAVRQDDDSVTLRVDTPDGEYDLTAGWAVAADGGRSAVRRLMELRMEGRSYPGNFVIADIQAKLDLPTERLCFFDPDWNPGNNVLVHRQPDDLWRIDFRLPDGETAEQALEPDLLARRIELVLGMIGKRVPWRLDWATVYSANTLTLPDYVHGRVLFTGDAAHLLPIFGVRGANTGFQDCNDLAWKLAFVVQGKAPRGLLETYSSERVQAAREICEEGGKSTRFMTPPTRGFRLMRDAVLSFTLSEEFCKDLLHWRTSRPHTYAHSPLNSFADEDRAFTGGPACGEPLRNVRLGEGDYLFDHFGTGFHLLVFAGADGLGEGQRALLRQAGELGVQLGVPMVRVILAAAPTPEMAALAEAVLADPGGRAAAKYAAGPGAAYLARPDTHVCARWRSATAGDVAHAVRVAMGTVPGETK